MKKSIFSSLFCFVAVSMFGQVVAVDDTNDLGERTVISIDEPLYNVKDKNKNYANFRIARTDFEGKKAYAFIVDFYEGQFQVNAGKKLLLNFEDGTSIELENGKRVANYELIGKIYKITCIYPVTPEQLEQMSQKHLANVHWEYNGGFLDRDAGSIFPTGVTICKKGVDKAFIPVKDFYSDF